MKEIRTEITIQADSQKVWDFFNHFENFPEWNPFIHSILGKVSIGNIIEIKLTPPDAQAMVFKPKVLNIVPKREIRWKGRLMIPGLFDGEHIFEFIGHPGHATTFIQREIFTGILVPFLKRMLDDNTKRGFELMNQKLKEKCER